MRMVRRLTAVLVVALLETVGCFVPHVSSFRGSFGLKASSSSSEEWRVSNEFPVFLNQCAIQSFICLLRSLRDAETASWMENFTEPVLSSAKSASKDYTPETAALLDDISSSSTPDHRSSKFMRYHGLGAMNTTKFPTWESYFIRLLREPKETWIIESTRPRVPTFEVEINPPSLCSRLVSVREQIAREFTNDLEVIANMIGKETLQNYWQSIQEGSDSKMAARTNLLFLDSNAYHDYTPSPLRKENFDLLMLLTTQESVYRLLNQQKQIEEPTFRFLQDFYVQRLLTHFTGVQAHGRADDFLIELLSCSPKLVNEEGTTFMVDPTKIAELVLEERRKVALEWKEIAANTPKSHMDIKRIQLNLLMGITSPSSSS